MKVKPETIRYLPDMKFCKSLITMAIASAVATSPASASLWTTQQGDNPDGPGTAFDVLHDGKPAARLIFGDGQMKPFLHLLGMDGELLTNPGIDAEGNEAGRFPHHRGIFIGWNQIRSELGNDDLWHLRRKESKEVTDVRVAELTDDHAEIVVDVVWRSSNNDDSGDNALIRETRTLRISKPSEATLVVDASFTLIAARDLRLDGDLQHAGIHFRAHRDVDQRRGETVYFWDPEVDAGGGRIVNPEMRWCRFIYPIGDRWYTTIQLNAPGNPTEELSWRDYGRFGFFFKREMAKDESFTVRYRFITTPATAPGEDGFDASTTAAIRQRSNAIHEAFAAEFE